MPQTLDLEQFVGRPTDRFSLDEREALVGKYIARAVYTPQTLPLQRIEAIGDSVADCVSMLRRRNLDPLDFEFVQLKPAY